MIEGGRRELADGGIIWTVYKVYEGRRVLAIARANPYKELKDQRKLVY